MTTTAIKAEQKVLKIDQPIAVSGVIKEKKKIGKSRTKRAGLVMSVARVDRGLRCYQDRRTSSCAGVYLAAIIEYCMRRFIKAAIEVTRAKKKTRVTTKALYRAKFSDELLTLLMKNRMIIHGGVPLGDDMSTVSKQKASKVKEEMKEEDGDTKKKAPASRKRKAAPKDEKKKTDTPQRKKSKKNAVEKKEMEDNDDVKLEKAAVVVVDEPKKPNQKEEKVDKVVVGDASPQEK